MSILKSFAILTLLTFCISCSSDSKTSNTDTKQTISVQDLADQSANNVQPTQVTPPTPEPAQNAEGVWHYTCTKGCAGGAGVASACAVCGEPLAHNQGYHSSAPAPNADPNAAATTPIQAPQPPVVEAPQNAQGVWHFTCAAGCEGGSGTAEACVGCGAILAHNAAYHN